MKSTANPSDEFGSSFLAGLLSNYAGYGLSMAAETAFKLRIPLKELTAIIATLQVLELEKNGCSREDACLEVYGKNMNPAFLRTKAQQDRKTFDRWTPQLAEAASQHAANYIFLRAQPGGRLSHASLMELFRCDFKFADAVIADLVTRGSLVKATKDYVFGTFQRRRMSDSVMGRFIICSRYAEMFGPSAVAKKSFIRKTFTFRADNRAKNKLLTFLNIANPAAGFSLPAKLDALEEKTKDRAGVSSDEELPSANIGCAVFFQEGKCDDSDESIDRFIDTVIATAYLPLSFPRLSWLFLDDKAKQELNTTLFERQMSIFSERLEEICGGFANKTNCVGDVRTYSIVLMVG